MNRIVAGEYIFNISDQMCQQAFNIRSQTLHAAHVMTSPAANPALLLNTTNPNIHINPDNNSFYLNMYENKSSQQVESCGHQAQAQVQAHMASDSNDLKCMINKMVKANERLFNEEGHLKLQKLLLSGLIWILGLVVLRRRAGLAAGEVIT